MSDNIKTINSLIYKTIPAEKFPLSFDSLAIPQINYLYLFIVSTIISIICFMIYYFFNIKTRNFIFMLIILNLLAIGIILVLGLISAKSLFEDNKLINISNLIDKTNSSIKSANNQGEINLELPDLSEIKNINPLKEMVNFSKTNINEVKKTYMDYNKQASSMFNTIDLDSTNSQLTTMNENLKNLNKAYSKYSLSEFSSLLEKYNNNLKSNIFNMNNLPTFSSSFFPLYDMQLVTLGNSNYNSIAIKSTLNNFLSNFNEKIVNQTYTLLYNNKQELQGLCYNYSTSPVKLNFIFLKIENKLYSICFQNNLFSWVIDPVFRLAAPLINQSTTMGTGELMILNMLNNTFNFYSLTSPATNLRASSISINLQNSQWTNPEKTQFSLQNSIQSPLSSFNLLSSSLFNSIFQYSINDKTLRISIVPLNVVFHFNFPQKININNNLFLENKDGKINAIDNTNGLNIIF